VQELKDVLKVLAKLLVKTAKEEGYLSVQAYIHARAQALFARSRFLPLGEQ